MTTELDRVLTHRGFFRIERTMLPPEGTKWGERIDPAAYVDFWQVGVALTEGSVEWWEGATLAEAIKGAAAAIDPSRCAPAAGSPDTRTDAPTPTDPETAT